MANDEDVQWVKLGADAWNGWMRGAEGSRNAAVDFSGATFEAIDFSRFQFPRECTFAGAVFSGPANFGSAVFHNKVTFEKARFSNEANFRHAIFNATASFEGAEFRKVDFVESKFFGNTYFSKATFQKVATFHEVEFSGDVWLRDTTFEGLADFDGITVEGDLTFRRARLKRGFYLSNAKLDGRVHLFTSDFAGDCRFVASRFNGGRTSFDDSTFGAVPDLRSTIFGVPPSFQRVKIGYARAKTIGGRFIGLAADRKDAAKYRRLKQLAFEAKDHDRELGFFIMEQRAKRGHDYRQVSRIVLDIVYDWLSEYGRSIARPVTWLVVLTALSFAVIADAYAATWSDVLAKVVPMLVLATTNATLLVGSDKWLLRSEAFKTLGVDDKTFGLSGELLAYGQSALSLLLLFLIGLALRNRFRIGSGG